MDDKLSANFKRNSSTTRTVPIHATAPAKLFEPDDQAGDTNEFYAHRQNEGTSVEQIPQPQGKARQLLACPVRKHAEIHGLASECSFPGGKNMWTIKQHLERKSNHCYVPFIKQCDNCRNYIANNVEWQQIHGIGTCIPHGKKLKQPRGAHLNTSWQWLFSDIFPYSTRIPNDGYVDNNGYTNIGFDDYALDETALDLSDDIHDGSNGFAPIAVVQAARPYFSAYPVIDCCDVPLKPNYNKLAASIAGISPLAMPTDLDNCAQGNHVSFAPNTRQKISASENPFLPLGSAAFSVEVDSLSGNDMVTPTRINNGTAPSSPAMTSYYIPEQPMLHRPLALTSSLINSHTVERIGSTDRLGFPSGPASGNSLSMGTLYRSHLAPSLNSQDKGYRVTPATQEGYTPEENFQNFSRDVLGMGGFQQFSLPPWRRHQEHIHEQESNQTELPRSIDIATSPYNLWVGVNINNTSLASKSRSS